jgi:radical SAM superfamily enzyme YgiQ (UPF0313 family)
LKEEIMRVGFVNTSSKQNFKPFRIAPLGSLLLLTILEAEFGDALDLSYTDLRGVQEDSLIYHIPEKDIYLHYVTTPEFNEIQSTVMNLRRIYPNAKHIAGGPHCNIFPEQSAATFDAICIGEGEEVIKDIINDCMKRTLQKVYKQKNPVDLNAYPYPLRKYLPKPAVVDVGLLNRKHYDLPGTSVLFTRGCPFNCHYCSNQYRGAIRFRSPELIIEEIKYLKREYGVKAILIKDDNGIPVNKRQAIKNLKAIGKTGILWRAQTRANGIGTEVIKLARDSGCVEIAVAIESVWQKSLDIMNKKINLQKAKEYLKLIKSEGMDIKLLFILGLPGEPKDIAQRTIDFIHEVEATNVALCTLCPIPGSELYKNPDRFGILINPEVSFDKYLFSFGRFDEKEKAPRFFEYKKITPFGESLTMDEIMDNYAKVQEYLRENEINF